MAGPESLPGVAPLTGNAYEDERAAAVEQGQIESAQHAEEAQLYQAQAARREELERAADAVHAENEQRKAALGEKADAAWQAYATHAVREPRPGALQIIAMALGGLGAALQHSNKNPVIDMWEAKVGESIRQQEADRARLGTMAEHAGRQVEKFVDWAQSDEARFATKMAGEMQAFGQNLLGTAAKYGSPAALARAKAGAAVAEGKAQDWAEKAKATEYQHQQDRIQQQNERKRIAISAGGLAEQRAGRLWQQRNTEQQQSTAMFKWGAENVIAASKDAADRAERMQGAAASGDVAQLKALKEEDEDLRNFGVKSPVPTVKRDAQGAPVIGEDGKPVLEFGYLKGDDGNAVKWAKGSAGDKAREKMTNGETALRLTDDLVNLIDANGGEADFLQSDAWKQMQSQASFLDPLLSQLTDQGVISGGDKKMFDQIKGGDPTAFRGNPIVGLRTMRENIVRKLTAELHNNSSYTKGDFKFPENTRFGDQDTVKNTPQEESTRAVEAGRLAKNTLGGLGGAQGSERLQGDIERAGPEGAAKLRPQDYLTPDAEATVTRLADDAAAGDQTSIAALRKIYRSSPEPVRRAIAEAAHGRRLELGGTNVNEEAFKQVDAPVEFLRSRFGGGF